MSRISYYICIFLLASCSPSSPFSKFDQQETSSAKSAQITRHPRLHPEESDRESFRVEAEFPFQISMKKFLIHPAHSSEINALIVLRGGTSAFSGGRDGVLTFSRITSPFVENKQVIETETVFQSSKPILSLAVSPDERYIAIAQSGEVSILDLRKRKVVALLTLLDSRVTALAWDPKNDFILLGLASGEINAWNFWGRPDRAKNSLSSMEFYYGSTSPISKLIIHPLARSFFSLEQKGILSFWKLQRTEIQQGLRDLNALIDEERLSKQRQIVAHIPDQAYDMYYSDDGYIYLPGANGTLYSYKIRGLVAEDPLVVGDSEVFSVTGFGSPTLLAMSNRKQRIDFWCENPSNKPEKIVQSRIFPYTISHLVSFPSSNYLWAATKRGKLLSLEYNSLFKGNKLKKRVDQICKNEGRSN